MCGIRTYTFPRLPASYNAAAVAELSKIAGRYAAFDDPDSSDLIPTSVPADENAPPAKENPVSDNVSTSPQSTPVVGVCGITKINYNDKLSEHFTLGMLSNKVFVKSYGHDIVSQHGFSDLQIACHLKALCENVLEAVWKKYPNFRINSGFRPYTGGKSQHERGMASDIQWEGISYQEYLTRAKWIRDNLIFDQLIFEHGNSIWIHLSFDPNKKTQRKDVRTMYKGKYPKGLILYY